MNLPGSIYEQADIRNLKTEDQDAFLLTLAKVYLRKGYYFVKHKQCGEKPQGSLLQASGSIIRGFQIKNWGQRKKLL